MKKKTDMLSVQSHDMLIGRNLDISPCILLPKPGQPVTYCNRTCPLLHIKSLRKSELRELSKNKFY